MTHFQIVQRQHYLRVYKPSTNCSIFKLTVDKFYLLLLVINMCICFLIFILYWEVNNYTA